MILHLQNVLDPGTVTALRERAQSLSFADGADTAGWAARQVKNNQQAQQDKRRDAIVNMVEQRLREHPVFAAATQPKSFPRLLVNRYGEGMSYGSHVDDAVIHGQRTDLSFTLGLTPLDEYQGGELVIEDSSGDRAWRLDAGDLLLYPTYYLHRVDPVSLGARLAVVGWVRSLVRQPQQRELLFDLELAMREEFEARGKSEQFDRLSRIRNNLVRQWAED